MCDLSPWFHRYTLLQPGNETRQVQCSVELSWIECSGKAWLLWIALRKHLDVFRKDDIIMETTNRIATGAHFLMWLSFSSDFSSNPTCLTTLPLCFSLVCMACTYLVCSFKIQLDFQEFLDLRNCQSWRAADVFSHQFLHWLFLNRVITIDQNNARISDNPFFSHPNSKETLSPLPQAFQADSNLRVIAMKVFFAIIITC